MSKMLYADAIVSGVVALDPSKPKRTTLVLQRSVGQDGDTITVMIYGEKANNAMYMIPTFNIKQLLELEPVEDNEEEAEEN